MELIKYRAYNHDYLIYDPIKNGMDLCESQVKRIFLSNLGGACNCIIVGPSTINNPSKAYVFHQKDAKKDNSKEQNVFAKYSKDAGYIKDELSIDEKEIRMIGKVVLFYDFIEKLKQV